MSEKKTIVISGGSSGIGKATAKRLVGDHTVVILSRDANELQATAQEIGCEAIACDVTDEAQVERAVAQVIQTHGRIDVLFNNAGVLIEGDLEDCAIEKIRTVIEVNVLGALFMARAVVPQMKAQKSGLIINTVSQAGLHAEAGHTVYQASKWAMTGFTKGLRLELQPHGVRVTGLYPGKVDTPLFENSGIGRKMNITKALKVDDVANAVSFIVSQDESVNIPEFGIMRVND